MRKLKRQFWVVSFVMFLLSSFALFIYLKYGDWVFANIVSWGVSIIFFVDGLIFFKRN